MAGTDDNNRPEPHGESQTEPQKDAPLPSFIYGRNGHGDDPSAGRDGAGHRQTQYGRIAEMDRKTLLGLATGAGMLGLVLFFVGMLVGAGLFMDPDEKTVTDVNATAQPEILATLPDETASDTTALTPVKPAPIEEPVTNDPVGDLIAERSAELANQGADDALNNVAETDIPVAPDVNDAPAAPAAPEIPVAAQSSDAEKAAAKAEQAASAPRQIKAPEIKSSETAPAAPDVPGSSDTVSAEPAKVAAKAEPEPTVKPASSVGVSGASTPFSVQVGAFKVHENASQRAEELRKLGLEVSVVARGPEGDAVWYYVRVGKYATMKEARDSATAVKKDHKLDGFPVRAEPNDREVS